MKENQLVSERGIWIWGEQRDQTPRGDADQSNTYPVNQSLTALLDLGGHNGALKKLPGFK